MQSLPPQCCGNLPPPPDIRRILCHLCTSWSSIDSDMALLADIFICQPSISHHAIAILVDCWSTCWSICWSTPEQVSANMSTNMSAYTWPVCWLTPGWPIRGVSIVGGISVDCVLKLEQGSWVSVLRIRYRGQRFENSFCSVVRVIPHQPHWVSLLEFCHGSMHLLMLHCPWIPLKCDAIAVPIFSKKQKYQTGKIHQSPLKIASWTPQQLQFEQTQYISSIKYHRVSAECR